MSIHVLKHPLSTRAKWKSQSPTTWSPLTSWTLIKVSCRFSGFKKLLKKSLLTSSHVHQGTGQSCEQTRGAQSQLVQQRRPWPWHQPSTCQHPQVEPGAQAPSQQAPCPVKIGPLCKLAHLKKFSNRMTSAFQTYPASRSHSYIWPKGRCRPYRTFLKIKKESPCTGWLNCLLFSSKGLKYKEGYMPLLIK